MALTQTQLANKRTRKILRRRTLLKGRRTAGPSHSVGRHRARRRLNAEILARFRESAEAQRAESRAAVREATAGKRGGFMDGVKSRLFKMMPRRTGGGE